MPIYANTSSGFLPKFGQGLEIVLLLAAMFLFSGGLLGSLLVDEHATDGSPLLRALFYPVYLLTIILAVLRPWSMGNALWRSMLLLVPVGLALASVNWSLNPDITVRRAFALVMTTLFAIYIASRFDWADFIELFAVGFLILAVLSVATVLILPEIGIMSEIHAGAWAGIYGEKNQLGMNMAKSAHLSLCAMIFRPSRRWFWAGAFLLAVALLVLSTSKTSLIALTLILSGMAGLYVIRKGPRLAVPMVYFGVVFGVGFAMALQFFPEFMFGLIGREPTLTGRTGIWMALFEQIKHRPWFGYGYAVFWLEETGPAFWVRQQTEWLVPTAHNGWLETWLSIGLAGVSCFAVVYVATVIAALRSVLSSQAAYWALISTLVFLLFSVSESNILQQNNLGWVVFAATAAKLFGARPLPQGSKTRSPIEFGFKPAKPEQFSEALGRPVANIGPIAGFEQPQGPTQSAIDNGLGRADTHPIQYFEPAPALPSGLRGALPEGKGFDQIITQTGASGGNLFVDPGIGGPSKSTPIILNTRK